MNTKEKDIASRKKVGRPIVLVYVGLPSFNTKFCSPGNPSVPNTLEWFVTLDEGRQNSVLVNCQTQKDILIENMVISGKFV